ncbi:type II toxin-antitoxin system HicB family antitoxin [Petroclostridium xylanilyticum]|jgi:predicted RNase H-like HicB family nuclease|uniref:type II toxin-antitoxin system HicB family antitoxin n=1 Tax=Petroclostridium xylanilyticum TaxID=1792311 RepID=UPI000B982966|nr:type II toxin-antitoxin system HicB family antitoxin [Petroclostridium xylanilyticum]
MKYVYPAIFTPLENGEYSIKVPDLPGCVTCGKDLPNAIEMAQDAVAMWLCDAEDNNETIPKASNVFDIRCEKTEFVNLIVVDTVEYRNLNDSRAIKKTLTIPNWLNTKAEKAGINFSQVLQEALRERLHI